MFNEQDLALKRCQVISRLTGIIGSIVSIERQLPVTQEEIKLLSDANEILYKVYNNISDNNKYFGL